MSPLRAHVVKGHFVIAEPTSLPEGTVLDLVIDDEGDTLDANERAALHHRLSAAGESAARGEGRDVSELLDELRARR